LCLHLPGVLLAWGMGRRKPHSQEPRGRSGMVSSGGYWWIRASFPYIQVGTTATCRVRLPEQTGDAKVRYENEGSGSSRRIEVSFEINNLIYSESGLFCKASGSSMVDGIYTGSTVVSGDKGGAWIE
jgi:hypothetical protein